MNPNTNEVTYLDMLKIGLQEEGFEVYVQPSSALLPTFLKKHRPDAIAVGRDKKIAIEIAHEGRTSRERMASLPTLFADHPDWELRVYWLKPSDASRHVKVASRKQVGANLKAVKDLAAEGKNPPALLMGWATLEAIGRLLLTDTFARPQTPGRLIEILASDGQLTPDEADRMRKLARMRNALIHGDLHVRVSEEDTKFFISILESLSEQIESITTE